MTDTKTLAGALVAAQAAMPAVDKDGTNPHFKSSFVTLGHLIAKVRPVLNDHGIMVAQFPSSHSDTGAPTLVTLLIHESGERIEYEAPLLLPKNDPQGFGSAMTYARRYALASALGISDQEDDDGNAATPAPGETNGNTVSKPSEKQVEFLTNLVRAMGVTAPDLDVIADWSAEHLTGGKQGTCSRAIESLKDKDQATLDWLVKKATAVPDDIPAEAFDV